MAVMRRSEAEFRIGQRSEWDQRSEGDRRTAGGAMRFATAVAAAAVVFLVVAVLWVSTCLDPIGVDAAACGVPQRTLLGLGAPAILLGGAVWAFVCTYRAWRARDEFWGWQGAGWFLVTVMLLTLTLGFPAVAGSALGG